MSRCSANEGLKHLMLARLYVNIFLCQNERGGEFRRRRSRSRISRPCCRPLDVATKGAEFRKTFDEMQSWGDHVSGDLSQGIRP